MEEDGVGPHAHGLDVADIDIEGTLDLRGCQNVGLLKFTRCTILSDVDLSFAKLLSASFTRCKLGVVTLDGLKAQAIYFDGSIVRSIKAIRMELDGSLYMRAHWYKNQQDMRPEEDKWKPFESEEGVDLSGSWFRGSVSCRGGVFNQANGAGKTNNSLTIEEVRIEDALILGPKDEIDKKWNRVRLKGNASFRGTEATTLCDEEATYASSGRVDAGHEEQSWRTETLNLRGFVYRRLRRPSKNEQEELRFRKEWLKLQPDDEGAEELTPGGFLPQPYEQLAAALTNMGRRDLARQILICRQERERRARTKRLKQQLDNEQKDSWNALKLRAKRCSLVVWNFIFKRIGYGYRSDLALAWGVTLTLLGVFVFQYAWSQDVMAPTRYLKVWDECRRAEAVMSLADPQACIPDSYPPFEAFWYSVDNFVPILDLRQREDWIPVGDFPSVGWAFRFYLYLHVTFGWLTTTLGVAGVLGLLNRESNWRICSVWRG